MCASKIQMLNPAKLEINYNPKCLEYYIISHINKINRIFRKPNKTPVRGYTCTYLLRHVSRAKSKIRGSVRREQRPMAFFFIFPHYTVFIYRVRYDRVEFVRVQITSETLKDLFVFDV